MRFVETRVFTQTIQRLLTDDEYRRLQVALLLRPEQGAPIPGSGGLRKMRWAPSGSGKRGGLRVIYYWIAGRDVAYMLFAYRKNVQEDLTPAQMRMLRRLIREELE
jgi:hypothetical protein